MCLNETEPMMCLLTFNCSKQSPNISDQMDASALNRSWPICFREQKFLIFLYFFDSLTEDKLITRVIMRSQSGRRERQTTLCSVLSSLASSSLELFFSFFFIFRTFPEEIIYDFFPFALLLMFLCTKKKQAE